MSKLRSMCAVCSECSLNLGFCRCLFRRFFSDLCYQSTNVVDYIVFALVYLIVTFVIKYT